MKEGAKALVERFALLLVGPSAHFQKDRKTAVQYQEQALLAKKNQPLIFSWSSLKIVNKQLTNEVSALEVKCTNFNNQCTIQPTLYPCSASNSIIFIKKNENNDDIINLVGHDKLFALSNKITADQLKRIKIDNNLYICLSKTLRVKMSDGGILSFVFH